MNKRIRKKKKDAALLKILRAAKPYSGLLFINKEKALLFDDAFAELEVTSPDVRSMLTIEAAYAGIIELRKGILYEVQK